MADVPAPAEDTAIGETQAQTPEVSEAPSTEATPPDAPETPAEPDRGDPRIAMQEERRKRQELEQRSNDPIWVYEQARRLGLAADETPSPPPQQTTPSPVAPRTPDVASIVEHQLDFRETIKAHPELNPDSGDKGLVAWAAALVDRGHKPSEAADIIFKTISKQAGKSVASEVSSTLEAKAASEAQKLAADAITSTAQASPGGDDEELDSRARNWRDPQDQEAAILEKLKRRGAQPA